jgi:hypothetical protein
VGPVVLGNLTRSATRASVSNGGKRVAFRELLEDEQLLAHHQQIDQRQCLAQQPVGADYIEKARDLASPIVVSVLTRYPNAPGGRGRAGELWRELDASLRRLAADR